MVDTCEFPEAPMDYCGCNGCLDPDSKKEIECLDCEDYTELTSDAQESILERLALLK